MGFIYLEAAYHFYKYLLLCYIAFTYLIHKWHVGIDEFEIWWTKPVIQNNKN